MHYWRLLAVCACGAAILATGAIFLARVYKRQVMTASAYTPVVSEAQALACTKSITYTTHLYWLVQQFDEVCQEVGLRYWVCGGTLIGAIRHKGLIAHDYDADTCILRAELPLFLEQAVPRLRARGLEVTLCKGCIYRLRHRDHQDSPITVGGVVDGKECTPWLDIDPHVIEGEETVLSPNPAHRKVYPKDTYRLSEVFPRKRVPFGWFNVSVPGNYRAHLDRQYKGWDKEIFNNTQKFRTPFTKKLLQPARWDFKQLPSLPRKPQSTADLTRPINTPPGPKAPDIDPSWLLQSNKSAKH